MNCAWLENERVDVVVAVLDWRGLEVWGDGAALAMGWDGWLVDGLRSEPVSSDEPPPLLHRAFALLLVFLLRLLLRAGFCGVVSPGRAWGWGSESRDDDEVRSEADSVVEEPELAMVRAWAEPFCGGRWAERFGVEACEGAPLFGDVDAIVAASSS